MSCWFSNPWQIALLTAYWIWLSIPAWCVFVVRVLTRRVTVKELLLMAAFAVCVAAEVFQLSAEAGAGSFGAREHWSLSRYFGVFGPLLWIWAAIGLSILWQVSKRPLRLWCRLLAIVWPVVLLFWQTIPFFADQQECGPAQDYWQAAKRASRVVRRTWQGPRRDHAFVFSLDEYHTARRPACFDDWAALAWWSGGQSEGANLGHYPHPPDYLFLNENAGYRGKESDYDPADYEFIGAFRGTRTEYGLFKRKEKGR